MVFEKDLSEGHKNEEYVAGVLNLIDNPNNRNAYHDGAEYDLQDRKGILHEMKLDKLTPTFFNLFIEVTRQSFDDANIREDAGLTTTKAEWWHITVESKIYSVRVETLRQYINENKSKLSFKAGGDGKRTGGYCISIHDFPQETFPPYPK